jgi:flagellum-specific ATP synthase
MINLVPAAHQQAARYLKQLYSRYQRNRDLISVGAYKPGSDPAIDQAIEAYPAIEAFLQQEIEVSASVAESLEGLARALETPRGAP